MILLGSSMGATIAIYVTANRPEVAGLVSFATGCRALSPPRRWSHERDRISATTSPPWRSGEGWSSAHRSGLEVAADLSFGLHGDADDVVCDPDSV